MRIPKTTSPKSEVLERIDTTGMSEVVEFRGLRSKVFKKGNEYKYISTGNLLHYPDGTEILKEIDLSWKKKGKTYECSTAPYTVVVNQATIGYTYTSLNGGTVSVSLVSVQNTAVNVPKPKITGNSIVWENVYTDTDFMCTLKEDGVELFKILKSPNSATEWVWLVVENGVTIQKKTFAVDAKNYAAQFVNEITPQDNGYLFLERFTGNVSTVDDKALAMRKRIWSTDITYPIIVDVSTSDTVSDTVDDGKQIAAYTNWYSVPYSTYSSNIWGWPSPPGANWHGGVRFRTVNVPQGVTINTATLQFQVVSITNSPSFRVYGDDVDDAALWAAGNLPSGITKTTAFTTWNETTTGVRTIDVKDIVQEIVNRAGWTANNDIRFAILNQTTGTNRRLLVKDLKAGAGTAPVLAIDYTASSIKTVDGLAYASVKTFNGLATGSIKNIDGLA